MRRNKYGAIKTKVDGIVFDSKSEANHYIKLKALQKAGVIKKLKRQVNFPFEITIRNPNNLELVVVEKLTYRADFVYDKNGKTIVDEVKGYETSQWKKKRKYFEALYPELTLIITK